MKHDNEDHSTKDTKAVAVTLFLSAADQERLAIIQRELSWFRKPVPVVWVLDWIFLRCQESPEIERELKTLVDTYSDNLQAEPLKTSVKIDAEVADWMAKTTGKSRLYKAPTVVIRWIIDEWDRIKILTGFEKYGSKHPKMHVVDTPGN